MFSDDFIFSLLRDLPFLLIRIFTVILLLLHLLFSFIIVRQTKIMGKIVIARFSPTVYILSVIHFLASLAVLIWTVLFLFVIPL